VTFEAQTYDYTARDYDALRDRLISLYTSVFPTWTQTDTRNLANLLRDGDAFVASVNDYYMCRRARGGFVPTATERRDMIALGKRQGYALSGAQAATGDLTVTVANAPLAGTVTLAAGDTVRTEDVVNPVVGEIQATVVIPVGGTTATLSWRHSQARTQVYTATIAANQEVYLPQGPYLEGSCAFATGLGAWTQVDSLALSASTDRHFEVLVDQNDRATVRFGDGVNGAIPTGTFTIGYEVGGGTAGNVEAGKLRKFGRTYTDSLGNQAVLTVTNAAETAGGVARETVNAARQQIPLSNRAPRTTVTRDDFEIHALEVPSVARALMLSSDEDSTVPEEEGRLYIVPAGGGPASAALVAAVTTMVIETYPILTGYRVLVSSANYLTVNVRAVIWIAAGYATSAVKAAILADLDAFFDPLSADGSVNSLVDFGYNYRDANDLPAGEIALSDIFNLVRDVAGVRKIGAGLDDFTLNGAHADLAIANYQFPALGTVVLVNGETGAVL
jgi:hypothetical protein